MYPRYLMQPRCVRQINDQFRSWQIIGVNEFTSKRGRMSIVLRPAGWSEGAVMYAKGKQLPISSRIKLPCKDVRTQSNRWYGKLGH